MTTKTNANQMESSGSQAVDVVRRYYQAFNRRDWPTFFGLMDEAIVHDLNQGAREVGRAAFEAFMDRMNRCYAETLEDIVLFQSATHASGAERVAAEYIVNGKYLSTDEGLPQATGQTYRIPGGAFFEVAGGRVRRVTNYYNLNEWLAAIGAGSRS